MKIKTTYIADDGKEFLKKEECVAHEERLRKKYEYAIVESYDMKSNRYVSKYYIKYEIKNDVLKKDVTVKDLVETYLLSVLGIKTLYSKTLKKYYNQYKIKKVEVNAGDKGAGDYVDITTDLYSDYFNDKSSKQAQELLRNWYNNI